MIKLFLSLFFILVSRFRQSWRWGGSYSIGCDISRRYHVFLRFGSTSSQRRKDAWFRLCFVYLFLYPRLVNLVASFVTTGTHLTFVWFGTAHRWCLAIVAFSKKCRLTRDLLKWRASMPKRRKTLQRYISTCQKSPICATDNQWNTFAYCVGHHG